MIPESLRTLLAHLIDYAGLYPPASLPLTDVVTNYERYLHSTEAWMLNRLVLPLEKLQEVTLGKNWHITLLVDVGRTPSSASDPLVAALPPQVETLETKAGGRLSLPTYCEVPLDQVEDGYAKIRTATPSSETLAEFLCGAAACRLPFKATAGLHHPIRSASMHGFLNVFVAATFAFKGIDRITVTKLLDETDPRAFVFQNHELRWREWRASTAEVGQARRDFAHSFGSCSFEEPVNDLRTLGLLS